ncbi:uncharacterized protein MONOS_565 [Monocercomonoides exilis]|uniref:uncharacterized protein n=1 Tax=Monocercomonoides exilis TaxID=2049356 RepID=UPI00355A3E9C|nr:hypothetical protein MONOS_565 [Monocercomonoides exilis]|eukprot:MONOS_565.1-p1 / transcript=MONOS_565.1 / gene=MONOS_565 / organism=Monocercomonoides_exilis_PA203 / gene_product=unspecified product / transcript_product=unspecified product / location=Mono_scaffold00009:64256-73240(+) / protein_length=2895 / sequence_SO=supercontig / SO=protein_coding / is_pseudo=false
MFLSVFIVCLSSVICGKDGNDRLRNEYDAFHVRRMEKSGILERRSVVQMFCEIHNSSVELKGMLLEKPDNCVMIEIRAGSLLKVEGSVFVRNNELNGHYVRNGGTCWLTNTTLGVGNGHECGMMWGIVKMDGGDLPKLFVRNSEFEDVVFCGSGSFLRDGSGSFEGIQNCAFANITRKFSETDTIQTGKERMMKMSSMEDCDVERSVNVLEGGIVSGTEGSDSFSCNNCTLVQNERVDQKVRNANRVETSKTQKFTNAEWIECSAICGGALYVHDNSSATLIVENSSFVKCNATSTRGGGIYALNIAECTVKHSTFVECYCVSSTDYGGAGAEIEGMTVQVFVENSPYGNDIFILDNNTDSQAIFCYSTGSNGNRYYADGDKSEWLPNEGGRNRFVASTQNQTNAKDTFSCGLNESYACSTISHCLSQMIVGFVEEIKVLSGTVVEGKGIDVGEKTISVNAVSFPGTAIETIFESNGLSLFCVGTGKLAVSDLSVIHNSSFENNRQCRLFEVQGSGLMDVKRMNISMDAAHSEERSIQNSLVKLEGGELKMFDVRWGRTFSTTSVISFSQGSTALLSLDNCMFSNIVRTTAGSSLMSMCEGPHSITFEGCTVDGCGSEDCDFGGGMMVEVGSGGSLNVKGGIAKNCHASTTQGRGGGIGLKVRDISTDFLISSAFEGNRAKWGSDIFVDSIDLESTARSGKIFSLTVSNSTINKIRGFDNGYDSIPIPLCVYLIPMSDEIYVSNADSFDHSHCGLAEFPCLTLKHCLTRQISEKKIVVDGMIELKNELTFGSFQHTIRGKDGNSGWNISDDLDGTGDSMITVSANANMGSLIFSIPSVLPNHEAFFSSSSQLFTVNSCSLSFQDSQSALSYVFLSVSAGDVSVTSFVVLSLIIGNCPLINLDGRNAAGTFTSMSVEDMSSTANSVLFGVTNGASFSIRDSTLSVKSSTGSIRVISTNSSKMLKLTNSSMSGFRGNGENGGAAICTIGRECSLEIVGGMMSGCESNGGNGGGLWVELEEGSTFTVGNMTNSDQANQVTSNDESNFFRLTNCKAIQSTDGTYGYGGGIYLHLDDGARSFILKDVSFSECDAREGKEIFINAHELTSVIDRRTIGFEVDLNNFTKLNGFERSTLNEIFAIPLVMYLWNNFSAPAYVGGASSHDFSMCGFVSFPCTTITKASCIHFEGKKKDVTILDPFVFEEELNLTENEWGIVSKENKTKCDIYDQKDGPQSGLIESSVSVSVTGVIFSSKKSLTFHESVFECLSGKLTLNGCGMEGGTEPISTVFVKAVGGVVEVVELATMNMKKGDLSVFVVEGNAESVPSMNMTNSDFGEITFGDGCVVKCHNGNIEEISGCTFSSITRSKGSGGCVSITNNEDDNDERDFKVEIDDCTFEGCAISGEEGTEIGGGALFYEASSKTNLLISLCKFYCCTAPYEEGSVGYGGGIMLKILKEEEAAFVISSPVFSSYKPNNAKNGKDLFILSPSLASSVKNETLPFVKDMLESLIEDSMKGYDGENKECSIPLINFWKEIGSIVHIAREGNNVVVCGFPNLPCESVDYGLNRGSNSFLELMTIQGVCDARSEMNVSGMRLEGTNMESDKIQFAQTLEGDEDAAVECKGVVLFNEVGILIPSHFDNEANILIHTGTDAIKTSVVSCSIHSLDDAEGELSFVLISASNGIVEIEKTKISDLVSRHEIICISPDCVVSIFETTFVDIALNGKSAIAMRKIVISGVGNENSEEIWNIQYEQCTFANVKHSVVNYPSLLCCDMPNEVRLKMENSSINDCGSTNSNEGGGVFFLLNERGRLEVNYTHVTDCFCSNNGRGGGLFLKTLSVAKKSLPFVLSNITFKENVASKGRDVFVKCTDLDSQISESQFLINFGDPFVRDLAIWGCTSDDYGDEEDLLGMVYVFRSEFIFVSSIVWNNSNSKNCGEMKGACSSLDIGVSHVIPSDYSQLYIWNETTLAGSCSAQRVTIKSMESNRNAEIKVNEIDFADEGAVTTSESVRLEKVSFVFDEMENIVCSCLIHQLNGSLILESVSFLSESRSLENSQTLFDFSLLIVENGLLEAEKCSVWHLGFSKPVFQIFNLERATFEDLTICKVRSTSSVIECGKSEKVIISKFIATNITLPNDSLISFEGSLPTLFVSLSQSSISNISRSTSGSCIVCTTQHMTNFEMCNCSFHECSSKSSKGSQVAIALTENVLMDSCKFEGNLIDNIEEMNDIADEICQWNGSIVDFLNSSVMMKDTTISNSPEGGITMSGGALTVNDGKFENNNPFIEGYPSLRRNIICSDSGTLNVLSLKGGDGLERNTSLWMLNDGCSFEGIASERDSSFFIPKLESVEGKEETGRMKLTFKGMILIPCNLSFSVVKRNGEEKEIETHDFDANGFLSEREAEVSVGKDFISSCGDEIEVSVYILFGNAESPSSTNPFILKNASETKGNGNERIVEGGKEQKSWAFIIAIIFVILFLIVLVVSVVLAVRWRKQKRRTEELEIIVEDTVRKDPKLIEMTTMEMSPEEQWRRAEREAERKNEERIKNRVYAKSLEHSESSEHLLSECDSTEYILGRDSDKIPEWALEKVEEEDTRKRTPSPSISSTSTTDTSDTDSTFVRSESLCPTTSSMSNLVDAMACSSPHEKLIVDLRDSLFMLLHGRNAKKEMAIGTLEEREQTAAQILFWVANLALHSFDEMENPLSSLANLSPLIVLFSEHMVICVAMHSDCSSDSDSSSISSASTIITSSSDCSTVNKNNRNLPPSSAFEDEENDRKECMRWKAPELMNGTKKQATKKTVVFSIGMMLWECLTLDIPFGEYEAEAAGQKIVNGERPNISSIGTTYLQLLKSSLATQANTRPTLVEIKRNFFSQAPAGAAQLTMSDAIDLQYYIDSKECNYETNCSLEVSF